MPKMFFSAMFVAALITPCVALAQTSGANPPGPPAKTGTFNGGNMTNGSAAQSGAGAKVIGTGSSGQIGNDTPARTMTGTVGTSDLAGASSTPSNTSQQQQ